MSTMDKYYTEILFTIKIEHGKLRGYTGKTSKQTYL